MKFAELTEGQIIHHPPVTVTEQEMLAFAESYDPQWFHTDVERAKSGRWQGLIGSGWLTCALAMRMMVDAALHDSECFGSPGLERLQWLKPVRPGDTIRLEVTVDAKRRSSSNPDLGIVNWTWRLFNQNDEQVLEIAVTNMYDLAT